ncbi:winged helix-turn-helix domain-containing protein [Streptomyces meridianus]|uniref:Winged helix-turn-helix domain-containing protein n=1 Tax=Streptomyces meridianus TaxID=2938945 RepID=A0ABT0XBY6_9ACTN|nr:winged helix-turn-helix domain-containing protein [Streptomyces meridianus]MCM2580011.1 winged helix-turn-helix domain-containing protein [Streptomyces meridianus]
MPSLTNPPDGTEPPRPVRRIDARSLRGLAHPLRMRILDLLALDGPTTATGLSGQLGENTGTVSWHLRQLAHHGFIEEDTGRGTKRERWWRAVDAKKTLNTADFRHDPATRGALSVYMHELLQQLFGRIETYLAEDWPEDWRGAGTIADWHDLRMTPAQLKQFNNELATVIARHAAAGPDAAHPSDALPVIVQLQAFPRKEGSAG